MLSPLDFSKRLSSFFCQRLFERQLLFITDSIECESEDQISLSPTASAPSFSQNPLSRVLKARSGSDVSLDCRPHASPRAISLWKKGTEILQRNERYLALEIICYYIEDFGHVIYFFVMLINFSNFLKDFPLPQWNS